ncbi:MAG TPA: hypothetical protein VHJ99_14060, partial [Candidatus Dormibacteraeota bacterium]|nr:hypothetical protein [Candidatus Dormibacteraeota bacterium]
EHLFTRADTVRFRMRAFTMPLSAIFLVAAALYLLANKLLPQCNLIPIGAAATSCEVRGLEISNLLAALPKVAM